MQGKLHLRLLYTIAYLTDFCAMLLIFATTRALAQADTSLLKMGAIGAVLSVTHAVSSFISGVSSDRIGRRRVILAGMLIMIASLAGALVLKADTWGYYAAYWACAVATGMVFPTLIAWINQGQPADPRSRHISRTIIRFCLAWNLGMIFGQYGGGWLFPWGRHWPIAVGLGLAVVNLCVVLLTGRHHTKPPAAIPTTEHQSHFEEQPIAAAFKRMGWIANLGGAFAVSTILHLFPRLAVSLGVPSGQHGTILALMRASIVATYLLVHHSRFWQYKFYPALIAQALAVGGLAVLSLARSVVALGVGLFAIAILVGYNYFASLYYSSASGGDERRGLASGVHEATFGVGIGAGSLGGGLVGTYAGERAPYVLAIGIITGLAVVQIVYFLRRVVPLRRALRENQKQQAPAV